MRKPAITSDTAMPWSELRREATIEEQALGADIYARALARQLDRSEGETSFAVFGHWGRGKTYLLKRVEEAIADANAIRHRYKVIWFSAWRYPTTPEAWAYLYETVLEAAHGHRLGSALGTTFRTRLARDGAPRAAAKLVVLALLLLPATLWITSVRQLAGVYGLLGAIGLVGLAWRIRKRSRDLLTYFRQVHHTSTLGLQAAIGADLRALLRGWLAPIGDEQDTAVSWRAILVVELGVVAIAGSIRASLLSVDALTACVITGVALTTGTALLLVAASVGERPQRVLLVVDDLDRCAPGVAIEILESLKLFVEDSRTGARLQIVALVEEDILAWSILRKYSVLFDSHSLLTGLTGQSERTELARRLVAEHMQKLFLAHLRLPRIPVDDLKSALQKIVGKVTSKTTERPVHELGPAVPRGRAAGRVLAPIDGASGPSLQVPPTGHHSTPLTNPAPAVPPRFENGAQLLEEPYSEAEQKALENALELLVHSRQVTAGRGASAAFCSSISWRACSTTCVAGMLIGGC